MADNSPRTPGSGENVASDEVTYSGDTTKVQLIRLVHVAGTEGSKTLSELVDDAAMGDAESNTTNHLNVHAYAALYNGSTWDRMRGDTTNGLDVDVTRVSGVVQTIGSMTTVSVDVTRPADTTTYAVNDALSDSTSAPTSGGFTISNAARSSGGSGMIVDAIITSSNDPATTLQGEIFIFDQATTNVNDNSAFAVSDTEIKNLVGVIPFTLEDVGNNDMYHARNLNIPFTCSGSANLRFLVRVKNGYVPASAEVITFRFKIARYD